MSMTTRAAVCRAPGRPWEITDLELDEPKANEVRIKFHAAGLCHSDDHIQKGDARMRFPVVGGHEGAGVVDASLSYLFIAHDLALVKQVSDRVAVMYLGKLCEIGPTRDIYREPLHPYTLALLASIPKPDPSAGTQEPGRVISGELPSPLNPPSGCRFRTRCPRARERCAAEVPQLRSIGRVSDKGDAHLVACHFPLVGGPGTQPDDRTELEVLGRRQPGIP